MIQMNLESTRMTALIGGLGLIFALAGSFSAKAADLEVGFVNVARVLDQIPQAAEARARMEDEFAPRDRELLSQQQQIRALEDRLVKDAAIMSASNHERLESRIRQLKREQRRSQDEFREDLNLRRSQELSKLQKQVTEIIQTMAKREEYDLIITDGVVFASDQINITQRVIELLQSAFDQQKNGG